MLSWVSEGFQIFGVFERVSYVLLVEQTSKKVNSTRQLVGFPLSLKVYLNASWSRHCQLRPRCGAWSHVWRPSSLESVCFLLSVQWQAGRKHGDCGILLIGTNVCGLVLKQGDFLTEFVWIFEICLFAPKIPRKKWNFKKESSDSSDFCRKALWEQH